LDFFSSYAVILVQFKHILFPWWTASDIEHNYYNISEVLSFSQKCEQKMIAHNGDNYIMSITILRDYYMK
jgi:hypothetical protein